MATSFYIDLKINSCSKVSKMAEYNGEVEVDKLECCPKLLGEESLHWVG